MLGKFFTQSVGSDWLRLPREATDAPSKFMARLDGVLGSSPAHGKRLELDPF